MAQDNQSQDQKNPLNKAVEHNATPDSNTDEHRAQDRQNQQNTMASTTATGADAAEQNDQVNGPSNEQGADNAEDAGGQPTAETSGSENSGKSQGRSADNGQGQQSGEQPQDDGNTGGSGSPQAVGGGAQRSAQPEQQQAPNRAEPEAQEQGQGTGGSGGQTSGQGAGQSPYDTETTSETFQVDVADATSKEMVVDGDFDTETNSETFEIQVDNVNDEVVIDDQQFPSFEANEDGQIVVTEAQLLSNASDIDGDDLSVLNLSIANASFETQVDPETGERSFVITPDEDVNGELELSFDVTDGQGSEVASSAVLNVVAVNDEVEIDTNSPLVFESQEDNQILITEAQLLANASDVDGDDLSLSNLQIEDATFTTQIDDETGEKSFLITPNQDVNGDLEITFDVSDGQGSVVPSSATLQVEAVNDAVIASDDGASSGPMVATFSASPDNAQQSSAIQVDEDGELVLRPEDLLANDTDADGDTLTITEVAATDDTHGTVELDESGNVVFTPDADYHGPASFEYTVTDGNGSFDSATVSVDVTPQNDAVVVEKTNIDGTEDTAITFTQEMLLQNATDVDSDTLTAINLDIDPQYGELKDNGDGSFTFTPKDDFNGEVPFTFEVDDNDGAVTPASGTLDVAAVNDVPVFAETSYTIAEDGSITITEASLLANVTDVDNDDLCVTNISVEGNGTITRDDETGNWIYTADADYSGDAALKITVNDTKVDAIFTAPVTITPEADEPSLTVSLTDMSLIDFGLGHDTALTGWHTDNHNNHIEIHQDYVYGVGDNRGGVIELEANRGDESNLYTNLDVKAGEVVTLEFDMSARKNHEGEDSQIDIYFEGQLIDSLAPEDIGWNHYSYQFTATTDNPKLEFDSPDDNSLGGILDSITVVKEVTEDLPTPLNIASALNDTDGSESLQSLVVDDLPDGAILSDGDNTFIADGESDSVDINGWDLSQLTFQGGENFHGPVSLKVTATSIEQATADDDTPETASTTASLDFNVVPVNDAVVIDGDSPLQFNTDEDTSIVITEAALLRNASDVDGDDLSVVNLSIADATFTTVVDPETGEKSYVVTPDPDVNGDLAVSFDVTDGEGSQVASGATLQVAAVNDAAIVGDIQLDGTEDVAFTFTQELLLQNASDIDGDELTAINLSIDEQYGSLVDNGNGSYTFTPAQDYNGDVPFSFEVDDGAGAITAATGNLDLEAVNDAVRARGMGRARAGRNERSESNESDPGAPSGRTFSSGESQAAGQQAPEPEQQAIEVSEDGQLVLSASEVLGSASDADGDELTISAVTATDDTHGKVELNDDGDVVFTPAPDYNGPASFEYTVTDGNGSFDTATVSVDITPQNDAAVVEEINIDGTEDTAITFTQEMLLQNATDVDSDILTAINLDIDPQYGELKDNGDGSFTFTPKDDFNGEVPFTFEVDDNDGAVTPASGTLDVAAVNDVPVFAETSYTIAEDGSITITEASLLANVTDVDNDDLCVTNISVEGNGTVTRDDETGDWTYTPDADYSGDTALKITVNDTKVDAIFTAPVTITPEADEPSLTVSLTDMSLIDFGLGHDTTLTGWHTDNHNNHIEIHQDYVYGVGDNRGGVIELEANRGDESNLYTNLDVKAGEVVTLEFDMSARKNHEGEDSQIDIYFEGQLIDSLAPEQIGWNHYSYQFTATTDNPKLEFDSPDDNSLGGILDSITVVKEVTEDLPTPLNINATLSDTDGSESLQSLVVDDLPDGAILSDGDNTFIADGESDSVDINGWDLSQLTFQGGENFHGPVSLKVTATSIEQATADDDTPETASTTASLDFNVVPVNDAVIIDGDSPLQFNTDEDTSIVITEAALLRNASDVDGDDLSVVNLSIADATFTTVVDPETGEKSYVVTPDPDVNGDLAVSFDVTDGEGSQVASGATLQVAAVNDGPEVSGNLEYTIDEDGTITLSQEQLLANASDVDGDKLTAENLQLDGEGKVERNDDGSYTITPDENFNGELNLTFEVKDGFETVATGLDLTVNAVNDEVVAADDSRMSAQEPQIRLDAEPEHGTVQCMNAEGEWEDMVVGREYPADAQVQFVPDTDDVQAGTRDIMVGSFDSDTSTTVFDGTASVDDWGTVDGNKAVYQEDGVTITTEVSKGDLAAWNGAGSHKGAGIGNDSKNGLSGDEYLTVTVEGEDVNQITFQLDGLGGYFDESSSKATEVIIQAFDTEGNLIDSQGGFRESGEYQDTYAFTTDVPVHHFTLGTEGGNGTYVVQNMTVSRTMSDEIQMTTIQADGSEDTNTLALDLNHSKADEAMDVTEQLVEVQQGITSRAIEVEEDGQLVIAPADLLANDTDADGDVLTITAVEATDDTHGKVELDEDGNVVFTPAPDYNGPASFTYTVTDGNGSFDTATVSVDVKPVEDLPQAPTLDLDVNEDQVLVIDPAFILSQATDADGDKLSLESLSLKQPPTGNLQLQQDGMYHLITPPDFNGLIELDYAISDGDDVVDGSLKVDVLPVNDAPFNGGNAHLTTYEDGAFTFRAEDMLDLFGDVDGDDLVVSKVITVEGEDAGDVEQNEDGSWTFTPADDYSGTAELQVEVSDPSGATTVMDVPVYIRPVADGAVITTDHDGPLVFDEDTTGLLGLNVDMLDASEQLSNLVITGFPVGFVVSDGENTFTVTVPGQVIDVTTWSFDDLSLTPPNDFSGSFFITVSATTADYGDESSNALPEPTEVYTDFDIAQGETLVLTLDDLLDMAEGLETTDTDSVQGVHLIDRSQGELVDNGDGTWSFTPAVDAQGPVDFAYQVNQGGDLVDVQSSISVTESTEQAENVNSAPVVDNIATTELGAGNELIFTDADMLGQLSDADNDELSIESVQLIGGQGVLETNSEGQYTFTPAQSFAGQAQIAFVATDGNSSIQSHFNVAVAEPEPSEFMLDEMGSLTLTSEELLGALNLSDESTITAVDYHGDQGTLIQDGDEWVFWSDDDFVGQLPLEVTSSDGETTAVHQLSLDVDEYQDPDSEPAMAESEQGDRQDVDTQTTSVEQSDDSQQDGEEADSDITAAPGSNVHFEVPEEIADNPDVVQVEISDLPEGASIANALLNGDGSYTVSGNLSKPLLMKLSDDFEGEATLQFEGQSDLGTAIDGASGTLTVDVSEEYAMQGNKGANNNQPAMQDEGGQNGDWTQGDNSNQGVDVMDDSSSYENDSSGSQQDDSPVMDENV